MFYECNWYNDISKAKFDVYCLFKDKKKGNDKKRAKVFKNNDSGFEEFLQWISRLDLEDPHFCMEATGCYGDALAEFLYKKNHKVSIVNPLQIKRYKESRLVRQKTDKSDASVITMFCQQNNPILWKPKPLEIKRLSDVNKHIGNLNDELTRWNNRLEKEYFEEHVHSETLRKIKELKAEIKMFKKEALKIINSSPEIKGTIERITDIVGIGDKSAISVLTQMPPIESFENADQFAAFIGVTPSQRKSGTSVNGQSKISKKGNRQIRKTLFMAAMAAKNKNKSFQPWVRKLQKKGKSEMLIVVAVLRKLMCIIFGMLKNGTKFDPKIAFPDVVVGTR